MTNASRIAWVVGVGASRGLGAASARRFAREGYKVAVTGRSPDALQVIVDEIVAAGGQAIPAAGDAQQESEIVRRGNRLATSPRNLPLRSPVGASVPAHPPDVGRDTGRSFV